MNGARYVNSSKDPLKLHTSSQASTVLMGKLLSFLQGLEPLSTVSVPFIHLSRHPPPPFLPLLLLFSSSSFVVLNVKPRTLSSLGKHHSGTGVKV